MNVGDRVRYIGPVPPYSHQHSSLTSLLGREEVVLALAPEWTGPRHNPNYWRVRVDIDGTPPVPLYAPATAFEPASAPDSTRSGRTGDEPSGERGSPG